MIIMNNEEIISNEEIRQMLEEAFRAGGRYKIQQNEHWHGRLPEWEIKLPDFDEWYKAFYGGDQ